MGPLFWALVGFCALFFTLNIVLHGRLEEGLHEDASSSSSTLEEPLPPVEETPPKKLVKSKDGLRMKKKTVAQKKTAAKQNTAMKTTATKETGVAHLPKMNMDLPAIPDPDEGDDQLGIASLYNFRGTVGRGQNGTAKHSSTEIIDMRQLSATLPFENTDGGVWKQGWDLQPRNVSEEEPLTVFIVPHSHNDPGWIKTFDVYFRTQTIHIISTVVESLEVDPKRRFIWAEISYFSWWWEEQSDDMRQRALALLEKRQFEFVTGGWVMPDEANSNLYALEVQMQEGHEWIREHLGEQHVPKYGWSIDPFGYSPTMPYILKNFGFEGILIQRVHYAVKKELAKRKHLEFYWRQTWDEEGTHDMFTHLMPFYSYDIPHTCGPDPSVCCQFDFYRKPFGKAGVCPWKKNPVKATKATIAERALLILDQYLKKATLYRGNAVLVPLGDDFRYMTRKEAEDQFTNYEDVITYVNDNVPGVRIQFGTLREYFEKIKGSFEPPVLKGSFFTYSDVNHDYWSGYFTSRAFDKALDRQLERVLYAADALGANHSELQEPRRQLSLFQHHDGVTGTARTAVVNDYAKRLYTSINQTQNWMLNEMKSHHSSMRDRDYAIEPCWQTEAPRDLTQSLCAETGEAFVFNPLERSQKCGAQKIPGKSVTTVELPCERTGPLNAQSSILFDPTTGLVVYPVQEQWLLWSVKQGGAYLFFPEKLIDYDMKDVNMQQGGWVVETKAWKRTLIEREISTNHTVLDFIFEVNVQKDNEEWFVRFGTGIHSAGLFHTDLNGFNFDTHSFRSDLPIQSQVFPMPTHASIQDNRTRLTVLSEHAQGAASLKDGAIDIFLDRRLLKDDGRGLGQGVRDNVPTRTRLRVILENQDLPSIGEFQITPLCRREWNRLNHPLEVFGRRARKYIPPPPPPPPPPRKKVPPIQKQQPVSEVEKKPIQKRQPLSEVDKKILELRKHRRRSILDDQLQNATEAEKQNTTAEWLPLEATMAYKRHSVGDSLAFLNKTAA
jgi:hypothetical protein